MNTREATIALNMLPKIGPVRVRRLLEQFGSAEKILQADSRSLMSVEGIGAETAEIIHDWENRIDLSQELDEVKRRGLSVVTQADDNYPVALRECYDPPLALYVWGDLSERDRHALAIVGSRRTSTYGIQTARQFGFQLASSGMTIVSGLARGIDTHAHEGAIAAKNGRTIAVIGSGLGQVYPPENMALAEKIANGRGAVVSEFSLNTAPSKKTFPMRNRIVAAWSQAVVVVECPEWSGARITANLAGEMGKTIYAVPGQIDRPTSAGCNALIREGAILVTGGHDILDDISALPLGKASSPQDQPPKPLPSLAGAEHEIFSVLENESLLMDEILSATGLSLPEINATLLKLEIMGLVKQLPGSRFARK
ncbi:DNA polymerase [Oceaniferula spumae]|uniref:DNA polymerase n=1 Tax=Oceaniferula spumae TaxID=2979115 RepID=A0AAT9FKX6_9BACT